jgi:hypothetical protein
MRAHVEGLILLLGGLTIHAMPLSYRPADTVVGKDEAMMVSTAQLIYLFLCPVLLSQIASIRSWLYTTITLRLTAQKPYIAASITTLPAATNSDVVVSPARRNEEDGYLRDDIGCPNICGLLGYSYCRLLGCVP